MKLSLLIAAKIKKSKMLTLDLTDQRPTCAGNDSVTFYKVSVNLALFSLSLDTIWCSHKVALLLKHRSLNWNGAQSTKKGPLQNVLSVDEQ